MGRSGEIVIVWWQISIISLCRYVSPTKGRQNGRDHDKKGVVSPVLSPICSWSRSFCRTVAISPTTVRQIGLDNGAGRQCDGRTTRKRPISRHWNSIVTSVFLSPFLSRFRPFCFTAYSRNGQNHPPCKKAKERQNEPERLKRQKKGEMATEKGEITTEFSVAFWSRPIFIDLSRDSDKFKEIENLCRSFSILPLSFFSNYI